MGLYDIAAEYAAAQARNEAEAFEYAMDRAFKPGKEDIVSDTDMLYMASLEKRNADLEAKVAELEEKHHNECGQIAHYSDELAKAKELLKAAVNDFHWLTKWKDGCELCGARYDNGDCPVNDNTECDEVYVWQHESEALALIGEDGERNG